MIFLCFHVSWFNGHWFLILSQFFLLHSSYYLVAFFFFNFQVIFFHHSHVLQNILLLHCVWLILLNKITSSSTQFTANEDFILLYFWIIFYCARWPMFFIPLPCDRRLTYFIFCIFLMVSQPGLEFVSTPLSGIAASSSIFHLSVPSVF